MLVHRSEIVKHLYSLNRYIKDLKSVSKMTADLGEQLATRSQIKELYELKANVLLKMVSERYARLQSFQISDTKQFYVVQIVREISFHIPNTKKIRSVIREILHQK